MPEIEFDNSPRVRRIIQTVCDLVHRPLGECRIVDLGCAHGGYALELARRGATCLGIEGRAAWIEQAKAGKRSLQLSNVDFVQDDVRNFSTEKYGSFDVVLCCGLLYHLNSPDLFEHLARISEACSDLTVIDTQISLRPAVETHWRGRTYWGCVFQEHVSGAEKRAKLASLGASLEDEQSFWLTRSSLLNALRHVGFTSVAECRNPVDNMYVQGEFRLHADFITLVAMKGKPIGNFIGMSARSEEEDWPENTGDFYFRPPPSEEASITRPLSRATSVLRSIRLPWRSRT